MVLWIVIVALFALALIGVFFPVLPEALFLWAGFLLYQFGLAAPGHGLPASFWWWMVVFSLLLVGSEFLANAYFVKKYGGSRWSALGALAGVLLGMLVLPPFGALVFPILIVLAIEMGVERRSWEQSLRTALGTIAAFFTSVLMKLFLMLAMIIWFFVSV